MQQPGINITVTHVQYGCPLVASEVAGKEAARAVYNLFRLHPETFPHIRYDYVHRAIFKTGGIIVVSGGRLLGALIYKEYKKPYGLALQGDILICQIVAREQRQGIGSVMMHSLLQYNTNTFAQCNANMFVTVRESNMEARLFYEKHGFEIIKRTSWKGGTIPGLVYWRRKA